MGVVTCAACGTETPRNLCQFCQRTVDLIREGRCVSCTVPVLAWSERIEGKCSSCRGRGNRLSAGTRYLLHQAADARHKAVEARRTIKRSVPGPTSKRDGGRRRQTPASPAA